MTNVCARCGYSLAPGDRFCAECGALTSEQEQSTAAHFEPPSSEITGTIYSLGTTNVTDSGPLEPVQTSKHAQLEPGTHALMILKGPAAGTRIDLVGEQMTVGRAPDTDVFLDDITVSRQHAHFDHVGDTWVLVDLGSLNGSYVNRERVDQVELEQGDEIQIGKYRFHYLTGSAVGVPE